MSNTLLRKAIATVSATAIVMSIVAPASVNADAYTLAQATAATALADAGVIKTQDSISGFKLGSTITRKEMAKVVMNLSGKEVSNTCAEIFSDLKSNDWGCKYAEAMVANGFAAANTSFRANDDISKWESTKLVLKAKGIDKAEGFGNNFQAAYAQAALNAGYISESFSDYNTSATRGWIFEAAAASIEEETTTPSLCEILGTCDTDKDTTTTTPEDKENTTTEDKDTTTPTTSTVDTLTVELSPSTPDAATIPGGVSGFAVAKYEVTAGKSDVTVNSILVQRTGLSDSDTLDGIAVFDDEGRLSKAKNENSSTREATLSLSGGYVIKAGETKTLTLVVDVNPIVKSANDEFALVIKEITATSDVKFEGGLTSETMRVGGVDAATVTIEKDGNVTNPKLGEEEADILKFKIEGGSDEDITLQKVTFKATDSAAEDALANFKLINDGDVIAETASMNGKYLSFDLNDGVVIKEDKTEKFVVKADVVGEAGESIAFYVDKTLDVTATGSKFGFGANINIAAVDNTKAGTESAAADTQVVGTFKIQAGEITIADIDPTKDEVRANKTNVELGKLKVTSKAGKDLELQAFGALITVEKGVGGKVNARDYLENVELYDETNGVVYELDSTAPSDKELFQDNDLSVAINSGTTTFVVRADTLDVDMNKVKFTTSIKVSGDGAYVKIVETQDDEEVKDITPSAISFKSVEGVDSSADVTVLSMADSNAVIGSSDVEVLKFEVETSDASSITIDEVQVNSELKVFDGSYDADALTNSHVNELKLYKGSVSESNLLDTVSGSQLADGIATFDGFKTTIAANADEDFIVTVSIVDDKTIAKDKMHFAVTSIDAEDDEADDVKIEANKAVFSGRDLTITGVGTLALDVDNTDSKTKDAKNVLGNTTLSDYVASFELTATNEDVLVEELKITGVGTSTDFQDSVKEVVLLDNDGVTELDREAANTAEVKFDSLPGSGIVIKEGSQNLYVKVVTEKIGKDSVGKATGALQLKLSITESEGNDSGINIDTVDHDSVAADDQDITLASNDFFVLPVGIATPSAVALTNTDLKNGGSTDVAKVNLKAIATTNTKATTSTVLKTELEKIRFKIGTSANVTPVASNFTIERSTGVLDSSKNSVEASSIETDTDGNKFVVFDVTNATKFGNNNELDTAGATFTVKFNGTVDSDSKDAFLELEMVQDATNPAVEFGDDDTAGVYKAILTDKIDTFGELKFDAN